MHVYKETVIANGCIFECYDTKQMNMLSILFIAHYRTTKSTHVAINIRKVTTKHVVTTNSGNFVTKELFWVSWYQIKA